MILITFVVLIVRLLIILLGTVHGHPHYGFYAHWVWWVIPLQLWILGTS